MANKEYDIMVRKGLAICYARNYQNCNCKKEKSKILNEFVALTGYNRSYASWMLRKAGRKIVIPTLMAPKLFWWPTLTIEPNANSKESIKNL